MLKRMLCILPVFFALAGCTTVNFTAPLEGTYNDAAHMAKNFAVVGSVIVNAQEIHKAGPLGIKKSVDGSKVGYSDLMREAAALGADDIIDVRIDINTGGKTGFFDWLTGWEKIFDYTGRAIAIKYVDEGGAEEAVVTNAADAPVVEPPAETNAGTGAESESNAGQSDEDAIQSLINR